MSNVNFVAGFLSIFACFMLSSYAHHHSMSSRLPQKKVAMFVFGDSLFDPGNNNDLNISILDKANRWPYGETFFKKPTGRFCNGRVITDFAAEYAKLPLSRPYLQSGDQQFIYGANFAAGGAAILPQINRGLIHLKTQLNFFKRVAYQLRQELGAKEVKRVLMEAIYISSIGGVDCTTYSQDYANATILEQQEFVKLLIGNLTDVIREIYNMKGRKFAFQNVGPMGCLPITKQVYGLTGDKCFETDLSVARLYNNALLEAVQVLEKQLQGFKYLVFDYYTLLYNIIENPSKYGFQVADVACCGFGLDNAGHCGISPYVLCSNVSEYVFFDGGHPTEKVNQQLAELLRNGEPSITIHYNLKQLLERESNVFHHFSSENYNLFSDE